VREFVLRENAMYRCVRMARSYLTPICSCAEKNL